MFYVDTAPNTYVAPMSYGDAVKLVDKLVSGPERRTYACVRDAKSNVVYARCRG